MSDVGEYEFQPPGAQPPEPPGTETNTPASESLGTGSHVALIVFVVMAIALAAAMIYLTYGRRPPPAAAVSAPATPAVPQESAPAVVETEQIPLPALDDSDALVRQRVGVLSSDPLVTTWLNTPDLIRHFVASVDNIAHGIAPSTHLRMLRPRAPFQVIARGGGAVIDPRSYQRFAPVAAAAASIDAPSAARVYGLFKPLLQMAFDELGNQEPIDQAVESAIVPLLQVPAIDGDVRVVPSHEGVGYEYADPRMEAMTGAQKQLRRMGPANVRVIQQQLRAFAVAVGVPAGRLP